LILLAKLFDLNGEGKIQQTPQEQQTLKVVAALTLTGLHFQAAQQASLELQSTWQFSTLT
jgi:hypothetical protein